MKTALITGSCGLVGAATSRRFLKENYRVLGLDNNMRAYFFGASASTDWARQSLENTSSNYIHYPIDLRDLEQLQLLFQEWNTEIKIIVHCAAQPSHDWAAREPLTDFGVNALATMQLLELARQHCPEATFIFCSTNKVYGDHPNKLPLQEFETRMEIDPEHPFFAQGIDENMSIDQCKHSIFGASKVAADLMVQEYGTYFGMKTAVFRGGCLTGPGHSGAQLHGFLAYLMKCTLEGRPYTIFDYKGKQVRDNIHSEDLVSAFWEFHKEPRPGEVYNIGGGRTSNCSMLEAIEICEQLCGRDLNYTYQEENRIGDHIWWVSDCSKFQSHYPSWRITHNIRSILSNIKDELSQRESTSHTGKETSIVHLTHEVLSPQTGN